MGLKLKSSSFLLGRIVNPSKPFPIYGFNPRLFGTNNAPTASKPLRILFCGSDSFSCESLRCLAKENRKFPGEIASIDVLIRPGKPHGRKLMEIREVPLKHVAEELGLPIHERDTFTGWDLPKPDGESINLIVAVSFGLFVPPRILNSVEYGGINVHPSLLPQYRGAAPIHHTIMNGDTVTGVTLQTLDPHKFDNGTILSQEAFPVPQPDTINFQGLLDFITPKAANLLVQGIRDRVFMNPDAIQLIKPAPKIKPIDRYIDFEKGISIDVERRYRALGRLWCYTRTWWSAKAKKRTIFKDFEVVTLSKKPIVPESQLQRVYRAFPKWEFLCIPVYPDPVYPGSITIPTVENGVGLRVKQILVEGQVAGSAIDAMHKVSKLTKDENHEGAMFMAVALTDFSEDGSQVVLRHDKGVVYEEKHLDSSQTLKINQARLIYHREP
ncbi:hypothetical protein DSL72_002754 [Monilinia vaccinii-corymbosi]|uniref:methionyl-tRNA formyltransferase n=1 Tax=Monilinia vaccinii-corymbosi TaxID=61207 RepID=A0A8A3PDI3_9HELO|nr:hypothetical protein DSL72_002754 [Monilinia vaccinii-corymbosi]